MTCRLFIADDVEALRVLWRELLAEDAGIEVVGEAADGRAALDGVRATQPDVLLLDLSMPRLDGLEVLRELRAEGARTAVVVASGFAGRRMARTALELGARDYFEKGAAIAELREKVWSACRSVAVGDPSA